MNKRSQKQEIETDLEVAAAASPPSDGRLCMDRGTQVARCIEPRAAPVTLTECGAGGAAGVSWVPVGVELGRKFLLPKLFGLMESDHDLLLTQLSTIHLSQCSCCLIWGFIRHKAKAARLAIVPVAHDSRADDSSERAEV